MLIRTLDLAFVRDNDVDEIQERLPTDHANPGAASLTGLDVARLILRRVTHLLFGTTASNANSDLMGILNRRVHRPDL